MKVKLLIKNEIIIEIIVKPEIMVCVIATCIVKINYMWSVA